MHFRQVNWRAFITLLGGVAAWPLVARRRGRSGQMRSSWRRCCALVRYPAKSSADLAN
jgi:hypothetical protein